MVGSALQLAHQVAGHQHRTARAGHGPQQPADPADALGIQAVDGLIEQQHRWIAEQRGGDPQPLPHAEREPAGAAVSHRGKPHQLQDLVHPLARQVVGVRQPQQVVAGAPARVGRSRVKQRANLAQQAAELAVGLAVNTGAPRVRPVQPEGRRIVVDFPAPLGPTRPVTRPGATVNDSRSTAVMAPYRLVRPSASMVASMATTVEAGSQWRVTRPSHLRAPRRG